MADSTYTVDYFKGATRLYVVDNTGDEMVMAAFDVKPWGGRAFTNAAGRPRTFGAVGGYATRADGYTLWHYGFRLTAEEAAEAYRARKEGALAEARQQADRARKALADLDRLTSADAGSVAREEANGDR